MERDEKHSGPSDDFESKQLMSESERHDPFVDDEENKLRQERLRSRGNSVLGIIPVEPRERSVQEAKSSHADNSFSDSHAASKPETPGNAPVDESNVTNLAASVPLSGTSSSYGSVQENTTQYGSINSSTHEESSYSPLMQPVSPRQDPIPENWRFEDSSFIEANRDDEELEYQSVKKSLQIPRARGHSNATVSSSSSWSDIEPPHNQARSDISDSDLSIIGKDKSSHDGLSTSEDEDGFVDVESQGSRSA